MTATQVYDLEVIFPAEAQAELQEVERDTGPLAEDEVRGRTLISLISPGTEIGSMYLGKKFPALPGYSTIFEIDEIGSGIEDLKVGDRVLGKGAWGTAGHRSYIPRAKRQGLVKVPDGLDPVVAVHGRLMGVSMATLLTTRARPTEQVLIFGLGPVGHLAAQMFQTFGYEVIAVDPSERRRQMLLDKGVKRVLDSTPLDDKSIARKVGLVLECSGHEQAALDGCRMIKKGGEVVLVGIPWQRRTDIYAQELLEAVFRGYANLRSGWEWEMPRQPVDFRTGTAYGNWAAAMQWLAEDRVNVDGLYTLVSPKDPQKIYQSLVKGEFDNLTAVFDWRNVQ